MSYRNEYDIRRCRDENLQLIKLTDQTKDMLLLLENFDAGFILARQTRIFSYGGTDAKSIIAHL